jgi:hypothetical protein
MGGGVVDGLSVIERVVQQRPGWTSVLGSGLVLTGFALFVVLFVTLLPILRDPVGAHGRWIPDEEPAAAQQLDHAGAAKPTADEPVTSGPEADDSIDELALAELEASLEEAVGSVGEDITARGALGSVNECSRSRTTPSPGTSLESGSTPRRPRPSPG